MKKKLVFFIVILLFLMERIFGGEFWMEGGTGLRFATIQEYLYAPKSDTDVVSLLEWKQQPVTTVNLNLQYQINKWIFSFDNTFGLPLQNAVMYDKDFDKDLCYNYSINEVQNQVDYTTLLQVEYNAYKNNKFSFNPAFSLIFSYNSMSSINGYGWYGSKAKTELSENVSWDDERAKPYEKGNLSGVDITRINVTTLLGFTTSYAFTQKFTISADIFISPYSYTNFTDFHRDDFNKGREKTLVFYNEGFFKSFFFNLDFSYQFDSDSKLCCITSFYFNKPDADETYIKGFISESMSAIDFMKSGQKSKENIYRFEVSLIYSKKI